MGCVNSRVLDRAVCNPNRGQCVADYYARVPKALVGLFAAFAPRLQNQRVVQRAIRLCSVSLRGAGQCVT